MGISESINYPLLNDLVEMGILSSKSSPQLKGPFNIKMEGFTGADTSGTQTLAESMLSGGLVGLFVNPISAGSANTMAVLVEDTDFSVSGTTLTWITDQQLNECVIVYAY
jgi:hypothetical protein